MSRPCLSTVASARPGRLVLFGIRPSGPATGRALFRSSRPWRRECLVRLDRFRHASNEWSTACVVFSDIDPIVVRERRLVLPADTWRSALGLRDPQQSPWERKRSRDGGIRTRPDDVGLRLPPSAELTGLFRISGWGRQQDLCVRRMRCQSPATRKRPRSPGTQPRDVVHM